MADILWTAEELTAALGADCTGIMPEGVSGISIDTRTLQPGDLFFAIKGDHSDGHAYIGKAFEAGAALVIAEKAYQGTAAGPVLRVADTLDALNALGQAGRARSHARIAAVTGSVGKTGTKEMLRLMLSRLGRVHASDKSYNNHWGVPLSLSRLPRNADFAVFEIGMNHPGEIIPLTRLVRPHAAIITTVAPVHIEFFDNIEAIAEAKAEIFAGVTPGGTAILNRDNGQYELLAARAAQAGIEQILTFGRSLEAHWRLISVEQDENGSSIKVNLHGEKIAYRLGTQGEHLAMNSLAALGAIRILGGDTHRASAALADFGAPAGRGAQTWHSIDDGRLLLIDEAYNANPVSIGAALDVLGSLSGQQVGRRIAVLGDMLELGAQSNAMHAALAVLIKNNDIDTVFCAGPHMAALYAALPEYRRGFWAETSSDLERPLIDALRPGDAIMIKGSLGSRMGLLVEAIKTQFPQCTLEAETPAA